MALIINTTAQQNFEDEGVSIPSVTSKFSTILNLSKQLYSLENTAVSDLVDPNCPTDIPAAAQTDWNEEYTVQFKCDIASSIASCQLSVFGIMYSLFDVTKNAAKSRQDVIDQLTATLTSYNNTDALQFLTDLQG